jgi:hypothetical protein
MQWVKPGADAQQLSKDIAQCQQQARHDAWLHYWPRPRVPIVVRDAKGRRFVIWQRDDLFDPFGDQFMEEHRLTYYCLWANGYELVPVPKAN